MAIQIDVRDSTYNENIVSGFASSSGVIDGQGMTMSNIELEKMVTKFMIKYKLNESTIDANHSIKNIGYIVESQILKTDDDRRKWWLSVKLINEDVIAKIKQAGVSGMSISGSGKENMRDDGILELSELDLTEVSILFPEPTSGDPNRPANPEAIPTMVKRMNSLITVCKNLFTKKEKINMDDLKKLEESLATLTKSIEGIPAMIDEKIGTKFTDLEKSMAEKYEVKKAVEPPPAKPEPNPEMEELKKSLAEATAKIAELTKAHETEVTEIKKALEEGIKSNQDQKPPAAKTESTLDMVKRLNQEANEKAGLKI